MKQDLAYRVEYCREKINWNNLTEYLKENNSSYSEIRLPLINILDIQFYLIDIEICDGDWKHDHLFLKNLMKKIGYVQIRENTTKSDGSDTYSSIHRFAKKDFYELFA